MRSNSLATLSDLGQSPWIECAGREVLRSGQLARWVERGELRGVVSDPVLHLEGPGPYDAPIRELARGGASAAEIHEALALEDAREAADLFAALHEDSGGDDGFASLAISPRHVHDTGRTVGEAERLWRLLDRPNVLVEVPATPAGIPAIRRLVGEGINVNVTRLYSIDRYREAAGAYLAGLSDALARGRPLDAIVSVASFVLCTVDETVDARLRAIAERGGARGREAAFLRGEVALATAKQAYARFERIFGSPRFRPLASRGARVQRLLWADTASRNPTSSDVRYVEPLVGPHTVSAMSLATLAAYEDHGRPGPRVTDGVHRAARLLQTLDRIGVSLQQTSTRLEAEGIEQSARDLDALLEAIERRRRRATGLPSA